MHIKQPTNVTILSKLTVILFLDMFDYNILYNDDYMKLKLNSVKLKSSLRHKYYIVHYTIQLPYEVQTPSPYIPMVSILCAVRA